jgi:hypothetical protein
MGRVSRLVVYTTLILSFAYRTCVGLSTTRNERPSQAQPPHNGAAICIKITIQTANYHQFSWYFSLDNWLFMQHYRE